MFSTIRRVAFYPVNFTVQQLMFLLSQVQTPEITGEDPRWKNKVEDAISALDLERKVIQQQNQRNQILEDKVSRLTTQLQSSNEKLVQKEGELTEANYQLESQKKKESELKNKFETQIRQMKDDYFKEKSSYESMIRELKNSNQSLNQNFSKLKIELESYKKKQEEIEIESKKEVENIEHSLQLERLERSKLERAIHGMRTGLEHRETLKQCLEQELAKADDRYQFIKNENEQLKEQSKVSVQKYEKINQKYTIESKQNEVKLNELQTQLKRTKAELKETKFQLNESQNRFKEIQSQLEEYQSQLKETQSQLKQHQSQIQKTQQKLKQNESNIKETRHRLHETEIEIEQSQASPLESSAWGEHPQEWVESSDQSKYYNPEEFPPLQKEEEKETFERTEEQKFIVTSTSN